MKNELVTIHLFGQRGLSTDSMIIHAQVWRMFKIENSSLSDTQLFHRYKALTPDDIKALADRAEQLDQPLKE